MSGQYPDHEGLQVVQHPVQEGLQVVQHPVQEGLEVDSRHQGLEVHYGPKPETNQDSGRGRAWCGLTRRQILVLVVLGVVVVGAAIGGGVGGTLSRKSNTNDSIASPSSSTTLSSSTTSPSSTTTSGSTTTSSSTSSIAPLQTSGIVALNCPAINNTQYTSEVGNGTTYNVFCQIDFKSTVNDIGSAIADSLDSCIDTCDSHNNGQVSQPCQGVTFDANLTKYVGNTRFNCFLKTSITAKVAYTQDNFQASALAVGINI